MAKGSHNGLTLDYRRHPKPRYPFKSFSDRIEWESSEAFWEAARSFIMLEEDSCPPAFWDFVIRTSDFWRCRPVLSNPAPGYLAQMPGFEEVLACGHWDEVFGKYELPARERPELLPRRDDVQADLVSLWQYATTGSNCSLPLSDVESTEDAHYVVRTAARELGIEGLVMAYAAGVPIEDVIISDRRQDIIA